LPSPLPMPMLSSPSPLLCTTFCLLIVATSCGQSHRYQKWCCCCHHGHYIDDSIIVVVMAARNNRSSLLASTNRAHPAPPPCRQQQRLQSDNSHSPPCPLSIRLIVVSSRARSLATCLSNHRHCCCATLVAPLPHVCRPLRFANSLSWRLHLLSCYCAPLVQFVVMLPLHTSPFVGCCVGLHHIIWRLGLPSPSYHASTSHCAPLVWLVVPSCCLAPRPLSPSCRASARCVGLSACHRLLLGHPAPLVQLVVVLPSALASLPLSSRPSFLVGCCVTSPRTLASISLSLRFPLTLGCHSALLGTPASLPLSSCLHLSSCPSCLC
jgi:hypothetical protein